MWYACLFTWNICSRDIPVVISIKKLSFYIHLFDLDKIMFTFWELDTEGASVVRFYNYNFFHMPWLISNNDLVIFSNMYNMLCNMLVICNSSGIKLLLSNIHKMAVKATPLNCWNSANSLNSKFYTVCIKWKTKMDIMF